MLNLPIERSGDGQTPSLNRSTPLLHRLLLDHQATLACLDLDLTLVDSPGFYGALEEMTCRQFGFNNTAEVRRVHKELQARSGDEIMAGLYHLAGGKGNTGVEFAEFNGFFHELIGKVKDGSLKLFLPELEIPGARDLIGALHTFGIEFQITTGSRPNVAKTLLEAAGLHPLFEGRQVICAGTTPEERKSHPSYWAKAFGSHAAERCVGFEDHPEAARWMLEAGAGKVFIRPIEETPLLRALVSDFGTRVHVVREWTELCGA